MQDEVPEAAPLMLRSVIGTDGTATPMLMFGQSELNNKDADTPNSAERLYTYNVAYANWTEDSSIYMRSLNSNRMTDNAYLHLPIYKFDTKSDLDSFKTQFDDILSMDQSYDEVPTFEYITAAYDDSFFSKYSLMLAYIQANSGASRSVSA